MVDNFIQFPKEEDWSRIYDASPFEGIFSLVDKFVTKVYDTQESSDFMTVAGVIGYTNDLYQRLSYIGRSYILMMFYYEKGIPDDRSHETSQQNGTTYWFPDFKQDDWHVKGWFNYFSDGFYYQLFSAFDTIGHILKLAI